jgi:hypothetical protein
LQQSSLHEWRRFGVCGGSHHVDSQALAIQDLRVADRGDETEKLRTRQSHVEVHGFQPIQLLSRPRSTHAASTSRVSLATDATCTVGFASISISTENVRASSNPATFMTMSRLLCPRARLRTRWSRTVLPSEVQIASNSQRRFRSRNREWHVQAAVHQRSQGSGRAPLLLRGSIPIWMTAQLGRPPAVIVPCGFHCREDFVGKLWAATMTRSARQPASHYRASDTPTRAAAGEKILSPSLSTIDAAELVGLKGHVARRFRPWPPPNPFFSACFL